jgi:hypothetical protein
MKARYLTSVVAVAAALTWPLAPWPAAGQAKGEKTPAGKGPSNLGKSVAQRGLPTPRTEDGKVDFSGVYHAPGYGPGDPRSKSGEGVAHNIANNLDPSDVPMQPWAKQVHEQRKYDLSKDDPEGLCLPMGVPRMNPYPWKIVQTDKLMVILFEGNVHSYRQIFLDGRPHDPEVEETFWGDSIGHWEGDTLVVDTVGLGFGDGRGNQAWLDAVGHPRTNKLHVIERFTRPEYARIVVEITIDDPGAYTRPWKVVQTSQLAPDWEILENICNENHDEFGRNQDVQHLVGRLPDEK